MPCVLMFCEEIRTELDCWLVLQLQLFLCDHVSYVLKDNVNMFITSIEAWINSLLDQVVAATEHCQSMLSIFVDAR